MPERLRVGIVGAGIGRHHAQSYLCFPELFDVRVVCDLDQARAGELATDLDIPRITTQVEDLYSADDLDIIDVCTPSNLHAPQTLRALAAGKHVVCEKPLAGSLAQVDEILRAEARSGRRVMPIFQYRFGLGLQKLKFLRDEGITGQALFTTSETAWRRRPDYYATPWRGKWATELGGALVTLAIHAHDAILYLLGPARSVCAQTATLVNPIETEDSVSASVRMADGSLCSLSVTTGSSAQISRHRFCFRNLAAESNTEPYSNTADPWTFTADSPETSAQVDEALGRFQPLPEGMPGQFYRYAMAMREGKELPVTVGQARAALELVTAIYHSARTGQRVELPIPETHEAYAGWQPKGKQG